MGVSTSKPPEFNPNDRDTWWLMHVEAVFKRFQGRQLDFAVPRAEFVSLLRDTHEGVSTLVDQLWAVFDPNHCGLANMLEVLAALSIVSCGEPQDKIRFIFALFDFEDSGTVQYDELVLIEPLLRAWQAATREGSFGDHLSVAAGNRVAFQPTSKI